MTIEELRRKLHGINYEEIDNQYSLFEEAKKNNLVIVFVEYDGDDFLCFRGAIDEETENLEEKIIPEGRLFFSKCRGYDDVCPYEQKIFDSIHHYVSVEYPKEKLYPEVKTNIKNAVSFDTIRWDSKSKLYFRGIIFSLDDVKAGEKMKEVENT